MPTTLTSELTGSALVRADGRSATRMRHTRGFVLLSVQAKRIAVRAEAAQERAMAKRPWRIAPPRGWEFASVSISDWSLASGRRANASLQRLGLSAALTLADDGRLEAQVQAVWEVDPPPRVWRAGVGLQVCVYAPAAQLAATSLALPGRPDPGMRRSRVPRAARGGRGAGARPGAREKLH